MLIEFIIGNIMPVLDGRVTLALVDIRLTYFSAKVQGAQTPGYLPPTGPRALPKGRGV
jgi:hypothetical protein